MKRYQAALYIFRRDLRIHDNTALNKALRCSEAVLPCFIFDPRQIDKHPYQSQPALQFMLQSLDELQSDLQSSGGRLAFFNDSPVQAIKRAVRESGVQAVFVNRDYTPFSRQRDHEIANICSELNIDFHSCPDCLLVEPEQAVKNDGSPYKVFTPFYNSARRFQVALPQPLVAGGLMKISENEPVTGYPDSRPENIAIPQGGRSRALAILDGLHKLKHYSGCRDCPSVDGTSRLSPHLKFGTCSVREAFYAISGQLGEEHALLRQLYWRDFYTHIAFHFPYVFGKAFLSRYDAITWDNNKEAFDRWRQGTTGFPIVDAGMRELNHSGFMHNRVRMITASFLTKDLHISWRWGERYFAQRLVDYDPCVNNGNWQWAASTGCDAQPYFRIFNPWLQQQKFDPECAYIKFWLPELSEIPVERIQHWYKKYDDSVDYPPPMLDHAEESKKAQEIYRQLS